MLTDPDFTKVADDGIARICDGTGIRTLDHILIVFPATPSATALTANN